MGTRLVMSLGVLADRVMTQGAFDPMQQHHLIERLRAELGCNRAGGGREEEEEEEYKQLEKRARASKVHCILNVTSTMQCMEGFACVSLWCGRIGAENAGRERKNLYVAPQHLQVPEDEREWEGAVPYVLI